MTQKQDQVITIDGPAASGKTSVSRELALRLGWQWVSTGAFYRGLAFVAHSLKTNLNDENALAKLALSPEWRVEMSEENTRVFLANKDVTDQIFQEDVGEIASRISHFPKLREALLIPQRNCRKGIAGLVAEGRDCGTVVFPDAQVKIYLTARQENRAERRAKDLGLSVEQTAKSQAQRDQQDSSRKAAPLQIPESAYVVDTTELNFQQVVDLVESYSRKHLKAF
jgi:cytidylate kinase